VLASPPKTRRRRFTVRRGLGLLASLVKLIALVVFVLLVVYILFTVFGANPANPWFIQKRLSADGDRSSWFLCSLPPGGESLTGVLRSKPFTIPSKLRFFLAGHDGYPNKAVEKKNVVRLRALDTGELLAETLPPRNDTAQLVTWDFTQPAAGVALADKSPAFADKLPAAITGRQGYLEVTDGDNGDAYAWLAIGRIRLRRIARGAWPLVTTDWQEILGAARAEAGVTREVQLFSSPVVSTPLTWGALSPVILGIRRHRPTAYRAHVPVSCLGPRALRPSHAIHRDTYRVARATAP